MEWTAIEGTWKIGEGAASELLTWANRFHDLVVVEQTDNVADEIGFDVAEQYALGSGQPTLVVPYRGHFPTVGRRILITWNGSREAAQAVHGALPFIEKVEQVDLFLGRGKETFLSITRYPDFKITDYLRCRTPRIEAGRFDGLMPKRERPCSTRRGRLARTWWSWEHTVDRGSANGFWAAQHGRSCAKCMFRF